MSDDLGNVQFIPEPDDARILSAVDPAAVEHQPGWRAEVMGWAPSPAMPIPMMNQWPRRIMNASVFMIGLLALWLVWRSQLLNIEPILPDSEWVFEQSEIRDLQQIGQTGDGIRVCIVDTGIDLTHPDLDHLSIEYRDYWSSSDIPVDHGALAHGTLMSGLLVADGHQLGAAQGISLGVVSALGENQDGSNSGDEKRVSNGIDWCISPFNADIISLSLGGMQDPESMSEGDISLTVRKAINKGIFVIAAAGNDGGPADDGLVAIPGNIEYVITVGASDINKDRWNGSSSGSQTVGGIDREDPHLKPEILAPGVGVISTGNQGSYFETQGTSVSTVIVTGALALILEDRPDLTSSENSNSDCILAVKWALRNSTLEAGATHSDSNGYGVLSAQKWYDEVMDIERC